MPPRKRELWHCFWTYNLLLLIKHGFYIKLFALWMINELCTFKSKLNIVHIGLMSQHSFLTKLPCKQDSIHKMKMRDSCITGLCKIKPHLHTVWIQTWGSRDIPPASWKWKATISLIIFSVGSKQNTWSNWFVNGIDTARSESWLYCKYPEVLFLAGLYRDSLYYFISLEKMTSGNVQYA